MSIEPLNCPQCGDALPHQFRHSKIAVCASCSSTVFIEDEHVRLAGEKSVLADMPSLIRLHQPFSWRNDSWQPVGHIRYAWEHGHWDEWWVLDNAGEGHWLSVDEGEFVMEQPVTITDKIPAYRSLKLDQELTLLDQDWWITELGQAECLGFEGELPEIIRVGERYDYAHLSGSMGELLTLEYPPDEPIKSYVGQWLDSFEIRTD